MLKMCENNIIYSQCTFKHTHIRCTVCRPGCMIHQVNWHLKTSSMVVCLALAACLTQFISTMFSSDVVASGEVQQYFHRTHGITCIKCRTCRWLLFVRAVLFVSTVLIIRHIAIRLGDQGSLPVIVVDSCRVDGTVHTTKSFHSTSPSQTRVLWSDPDTCSDLK